jgi:hypothetical protein
MGLPSPRREWMAVHQLPPGARVEQVGLSDDVCAVEGPQLHRAVGVLEQKVALPVRREMIDRDELPSLLAPPDVGFWHFSVVRGRPHYVRYRGQAATPRPSTERCFDRFRAAARMIALISAAAS